MKISIVALSLMFAASTAFGDEVAGTPEPPTSEDIQAARVEANINAGFLSDRAQALAANLAHAERRAKAAESELAKTKGELKAVNAENTRLKDDLAKATK